MNFTLLQAATKSVGWGQQLIFFVPMIIFIASLVFVIRKGKSQPLIPTIFFLGLGFLILLGIIISLFDYGLTYSNHYRESMASYFILMLIFLVPGTYYLYKAIQKKNINSKITANEETSTNNLQTDIYTQITNLNELKEKGIITEDEFQDKKKKLLAKI